MKRCGQKDGYRPYGSDSGKHPDQGPQKNSNEAEEEVDGLKPDRKPVEEIMKQFH
jgi:hypothetical protein